MLDKSVNVCFNGIETGIERKKYPRSDSAESRWLV